MMIGRTAARTSGVPPTMPSRMKRLKEPSMPAEPHFM